MSLPVTESFTDANGTALSTHNANWKVARPIGALTIQGNRLRGVTASVSNLFYWDGDIPNADQYCQAVAVTVDTGIGYQGPGVRIGASTAGNGYFVESSNTDRELAIIVANSGSLIFNDAGALANGDLQRLEASGNSLNYKINGTSINGGGTTDNTFAGPGRLGVDVYSNSATTELDTWEGGNLSTSPSGTIAANLTPLTIVASGIQTNRATIAANLPPLTISASGTAGSGGTTGTIAANLTRLSAAATGLVTNTGIGAAHLTPLSAAALGADPPLRIISPDFLIGYALAFDSGALPDAYVYESVAGREFNAMSPENGFKMGEGVHPTQATYDFTETDAEVAFAQSKTQQITACGPLAWGTNIPSWLSGGSWDATTLTAVLDDWIDTMVGRYAGQIYSWEVVNEPINTASIWNSIIGSTYIDHAFRRARAADPDAILIINEFSVEEVNSTSDAYYSMVSGLVAGGTPIDGVGFQFHVTESGYDWTSVATNFARFAALGLKLYITELDVRIPDPPSGTDLTNQASVYSSAFSTAIAQPACKGVTMWGFTDKYSWIPSSFSGLGAALPFDTNYNAKPAYTAIRNLFPLALSGTLAANLTPLQIAGTGTVSGVNAGTIAANLPKLSVAASGNTFNNGTIAANLTPLSMNASGLAADGNIGTIAANLTALSMAAAGGETFTGSIAANLTRLSMVGVGLVPFAPPTIGEADPVIGPPVGTAVEV